MPWPSARLVVADGAPKEVWLKARRNFITASDAAVLTGDHPFCTREELLMKKLHGDDTPPNDRMWMGSMREESNQAIFGACVGRRTQVTRALYAHPEHEFLGATPDGVLLASYEPSERPYVPRTLKVALPPFVATGAVLEGKNVASKSRSYWKKPRPVDKAWDKKDRLFHYWAQVQHQLLVLQEPYGILYAVVDAAEVYHYVIQANEKYQARLVEEGHRFWQEVLAARF